LHVAFLFQAGLVQQA